MAAIYQSDLWCDDCGHAICEKLISTPDASSDDYPKFCFDPGESDTPSHCAAGEECLNAIELPSGRKIGDLVGDKLTSYGVEYVQEAIKDALGGEVAEYWAEAFADYL